MGSIEKGLGMNAVKKGLIFVFAMGAYGFFLMSVLVLFLFLINVGPWLGIDTGQVYGAPWLINGLLVLLFATHHSVLARSGIKSWLNRYLPTNSERPLYVLVSSALLVLLMVAWQPLDGTLWQVESTWATWSLYALYGFGWLLMVASTFQISHWELFGLKQAFDALKNRTENPENHHFLTPFLYRLVRHPMMTGVLILLWSTPEMSVGHAYLASLLSVYIWIGTSFEERDLLKYFGQQYARYKQSVPRLIPGLKRWSQKARLEKDSGGML